MIKSWSNWFCFHIEYQFFPKSRHPLAHVRACLLFPLFTNNLGGPEEISWSKLESSLLAKNAVEKIVVINKEIAQIYVKQDALDDSDLKNDPNGILWIENFFTGVCHQNRPFQN